MSGQIDQYINAILLYFPSNCGIGLTDDIPPVFGGCPQSSGHLIGLFSIGVTENLDQRAIMCCQDRLKK